MTPFSELIFIQTIRSSFSFLELIISPSFQAFARVALVLSAMFLFLFLFFFCLFVFVLFLNLFLIVVVAVFLCYSFHFVV